MSAWEAQAGAQRPGSKQDQLRNATYQGASATSRDGQQTAQCHRSSAREAATTARRANARDVLFGFLFGTMLAALASGARETLGWAREIRWPPSKRLARLSTDPAASTH